MNHAILVWNLELGKQTVYILLKSNSFACNKMQIPNIKSEFCKATQLFDYHNNPKYRDRKAIDNSVVRDQNVVSNQNLHCHTYSNIFDTS